MNNYKVYVTHRTSIIVKAKNAANARLRAWKEIKNGYTYGWSRKDFIKNASVVRL